MLLVIVLLLEKASVETGGSTSDRSRANCGESVGLNMPERNVSCRDIMHSLSKRPVNADRGER